MKVVFEEKLSLPSGRPANQEVKITYSFDDNGTMHASFVDVETGKETKTSLSKIAVSKSKSDKTDKFIVD